MDPLEIEDSSDWLGCPTELDTCRHYLRMLENEVQELTLQLRNAREDIFGLVQMHADVSNDWDHLRSELNCARTDASDANRKEGNIQVKRSLELMLKDKVISELCAKVRTLTGADPFTQLPPR